MFVPGDRRRMHEKALGLPVDAIMLDLEDGVAPAEKPGARALIAETLDACAAAPERRTPARFVRVNPSKHPDVEADLAAAVRAGADGLVLPKTERPADVDWFDGRVRERELAQGLPGGRLRFLAAIESPAGLMSAFAIAASSPRVTGLLFGAEDFALELGLPAVRTDEARELLYARSAVTIAAAAAHVQSVDGVWPWLDDPEGLDRDARQARNLGFSGKSLFHPSQIDAINATFSPSAEDVALARRIVDAFDEAEAQGRGAVAFGGQLLDRPIVDRARRTVAADEAP